MSNQSNPTQNARCPICTSILTKEDRAQAAVNGLRYIEALESERNAMMTILFEILREHGGEVSLRRMPTPEEVSRANIEYTPQGDGMKVSLPAGVVVEGHSLIVAGR